MDKYDHYSYSTVLLQLHKTLFIGGPSSSRIEVRWDMFPQAGESGPFVTFSRYGASLAALRFLIKGTSYSCCETMWARANCGLEDSESILETPGDGYPGRARENRWLLRVRRLFANIGYAFWLYLRWVAIHSLWRPVTAT